MISRRTALRSAAVIGGVGAAGVGAHLGGVLDDAFRAVGVRPHAESDPRDVALLADAARGQSDLIAALEAINDREHVDDLATIRDVLTEQLSAVSDAPPPANVASSSVADLAALADRIDATAAARTDGALAASSLAVIKVLAAMAAGLDQVAVSVRRLD